MLCACPATRLLPRQVAGQGWAGVQQAVAMRADPHIYVPNSASPGDFIFFILMTQRTGPPHLPIAEF